MSFNSDYNVAAVEVLGSKIMKAFSVSVHKMVLGPQKPNLTDGENVLFNQAWGFLLQCLEMGNATDILITAWHLLESSDFG